MELYNDLIFSGKGLYNIINDDNIYTNQGIIFKTINSNKDLSINADNNYLNLSINPISIDLNYNKPISFNNIFNISSNSNVGIGIINPQNPLDVAGTISCIDINISNSILNKDYIKNIGFSAVNINKGVLKIINGGTNTSNINQEQLLFGNFQQSPFLIWKNDERKLGIGTINPRENLDISGDTNALYYRINGNDINNIFVKDFYSSSNDCFKNCSNISFLNSANYTNIISYDLVNIINSRSLDWVKNNERNTFIKLKVGIGSSLPKSSLDIIGDINYTGELRINGVLNKIFKGDYTELTNSPGYTWNISNGNLYNLNFASVGIGSSIPKYTLDINGSINYKTNIKKNGEIINFFDGNYNKLSNLPILSKFAMSGSYYNLTELPNLFNGYYEKLIDKPSYFPTNWDINISNIPKFFNTEWNTNILNKPDYFKTNWTTHISNKPKLYPVNWDTNIINKPNFFLADWNTTIINKPTTYNVDWNSNIYNKPYFNEFAFTGDFKDLLNKPYIFSGYYKDLLEKPNYSPVSFTGDYNDLLIRPKIFSGEYNELFNIPLNFISDWKSTIVNKPDFPTISFSGLFKDITGVSSIDTWGENKNNIYSCNVSNIGIGITNPSFKLDISGSININDGLIINNVNYLKKNNPWGLYFAEDFDGSLLRDSSGNERHATTSGTITKTCGSSNGALGNINYLTGGTSSIIEWPDGSIPSNFTILSLTRWTGGSRQRILSSPVGNWLHGHWGGLRGVCHYDYWIKGDPSIGNLDDWLCCIGKNSSSTPNNILIDGVPYGQTGNGNGGYRLGINNNPWAVYGEVSDWAFGCVIVWDYHLTDEDCVFYNSLIKTYLNTGGSIKNIFKENNIYLNNDCFFKNSNNFKFLTSNDFYITSNWSINSNSNSNIYNLNKGSIGINKFNPSSSYKLDVNGNINTTSNLSLLEGFSWSSYNSEIRCPKTNNAIYSPSSLINDLVIRTQLNKKLILANGNNNEVLFLNSGNIGIGTTNPSSIIHLHKPLNEQEINLSLSTSLSIYKSINHEGIIWNTKGLCFGTNKTQRLLLSMERQNLLPWGIYFAGNFSNNILYDTSGNGRHATTTGTITKETKNGNGATSNIKYISGDTTSSITWPSGSIPNNFTILSLTRYTSDIQKKILVARKINDNDEWYHGHNDGKKGVCYYQEFKTLSNGITTGNSTDWIYIIGKNDGSIPSNININGVNSGINSGGTGNLQLGINLTDNDWTLTYEYITRPYWVWYGSYGNIEYYTETIKKINYIDTKSDWALSYIVIWDRHLIDEEITLVKTLISNYLNNSIEPSFLTPFISIQNTKIDVENNLTLMNLYNSSLNQEVKINLTDKSSSTLGISIYKSTNNNGNLFNNINNHLIFGTNNIEKLRITNSGNVGIGTTNPLSIIHLHNISSNKEIKLLLSSTFSLSKNTSNEGIILNTSKGLIFGTNNSEKLSINNIEKKDPWGIYFAGNFSNNILYDTSGNGRHAITTGNITSNNDSNFGATTSIKFISGDTSSTITWPSGSIPSNFTILSLTRYTGETRGRILQSSSQDWIHGHHGGNRGVCHYQNWKTSYNSRGIQNNWLICIGKNSSTIPNNILVDGVSVGNVSGGDGNRTLVIKNTGEVSNWALSYVVIWNRHLTDDEMIFNSSLLTNYLLSGTDIYNNYNNLLDPIETSYSGIYSSLPFDIIYNGTYYHWLTGASGIILTRSGGSTFNNIGSLGRNRASFVNYQNLILQAKPGDTIRLNANNNPIGILNIYLTAFINFGSGYFSLGSQAINQSGTAQWDYVIPESTIAGNYGLLISVSFNSAGNYYYTSANFYSLHIIDNSQQYIDINTNLGLINLHNFYDNKKVNISLSTTFSILKNRNNDGNIWNNINNHLIFGTNNTERLRITNTGNIGIGTTNPSSIIHLHNISSNQEIKLLLSSTFFISKNTSNDGIILNTSKGISFATNNNERLSINNFEKIEPWGIYFADNFSNNILYDISGYGRNAITSGTITKTTASGDGATRAITYISGNTSSTITWPSGSIPSNFTILSLTRYTGETRGRILQSSSQDWIHGHHGGNRGVCHYQNWKTSYNSRGIQNNWLICIGKNSSTIPNNILVDGVSVGNVSGGDGNRTLVIKNTGEVSNWALSYVVIWNRHLTDDEMIFNSSLLTNYLLSGTIPLFVSVNRGGKIEINNNLINLHNTSLNQEVKINLTDNSSTNGLFIYKGATNDGYIWNTTNNNLIFGTNNIERLRITNSGNIGIGTTNPIYTLNVNGTINATNLRGNGDNITNLDFEKITNGFLKIINGGINNSNLIPNQILIGNGTTDIKQTSNLFWNNSSFCLGICSSSPQYTLDVYGTIKANYFRGNGNNISNLDFTKITSGILSINNGGIGTSTLTANQILIGNGTDAIKQTNNLYWNSSTSKLGICSSSPLFHIDVGGSLRAIKLFGNGSNITNINVSNFANIISLNNGGTSKSVFESNQILIGGDATTPIKQSINLIWNISSSKLGIGNTNPDYNVDINGSLRGTFITGNGSNISNLNVSNFASGICSVNTGGTGKSTFESNQILIGNGTGAITQTPNIIWNNTSNRLGIFIANPNYTLDVIGNINFTGNLTQNGEIYKGIGKLVNWDLTSGTSNIYYNTGSVGIGINSINPAYKLNVNDKIKCLNINLGNNFDDSYCELLPLKVTLNKKYTSVSTTRILFNLDTKIENINDYSSNLLKFETKLLSDISSNGFYFKDNNVGISTIFSTNSPRYPLSVYNNSTNIYNNITGYITEFNKVVFNITGTNNTITKKTLFSYALFVSSGTIVFTEDIIADVLLVAEGGMALGPAQLQGFIGYGGGGGGVGIGTIRFVRNTIYNIYIGGYDSDESLATQILGGNINEIAYRGQFGWMNALINNINQDYYGSRGGYINSADLKVRSLGKSSSGTNATITYYGNLGSGSGGGGGAGSAGSGINAGNGLESSITGIPLRYGAGGYGFNYSGGKKFGNPSIGTISYGSGLNAINYNNLGIYNSSNYGAVIIRYNYPSVFSPIYKENTNISNISAEFRNTIQVKGDIVAYSDNRIKKDIFDINSKNALDLISKINPKSFNYIDNIEKGIKNNYGFIAQDIIKNIPDAVKFTKDIIPNIMKKYRIKDDIIETNEDLTSKLLINDNIEIIDKDNKRNKYKILEISSNYIKIDKSIEDNYGFIYGKEVDDLHILDKKIIFTLNVSATQELNKKIKKQQRKLLKQEMKLIKQEKIIKEQELKFEEQEKQLKYLFINYY
jgi:hypothetical protein